MFSSAPERPPAQAAIGLICRYDEEAGWYEFNVVQRRDLQRALRTMACTRGCKYIPLGRSGPFAAGNLNYEIGLSCQDNFIFLYVNDALIRRLDVTNFGLTEGKIGITASSLREAPITVLFEWVRVAWSQAKIPDCDSPLFIKNLRAVNRILAYIV
jgi:hypothetical protein